MNPWFDKDSEEKIENFSEEYSIWVNPPNHFTIPSLWYWRELFSKYEFSENDPNEDPDSKSI